MCANLMDADGDRVAPMPATEALTGTLASSLYRLKDIDNTDGGFFVFGDVSVKVEGTFRLKFSLFEVISRTAQTDPGDEVAHLKSVISHPFTVYPNKTFPGMSPSTFLSRSFCDQGVRIRIRKENRMQMKSNKHGDPEQVVLGDQEDSKRARDAGQFPDHTAIPHVPLHSSHTSSSQDMQSRGPVRRPPHISLSTLPARIERRNSQSFHPYAQPLPSPNYVQDNGYAYPHNHHTTSSNWSTSPGPNSQYFGMITPVSGSYTSQCESRRSSFPHLNQIPHFTPPVTPGAQPMQSMNHPTMAAISHNQYSGMMYTPSNGALPMSAVNSRTENTNVVQPCSDQYLVQDVHPGGYQEPDYHFSSQRRLSHGDYIQSDQQSVHLQRSLSTQSGSAYNHNNYDHRSSPRTASALDTQPHSRTHVGCRSDASTTNFPDSTLADTSNLKLPPLQLPRDLSCRAYEHSPPEEYHIQYARDQQQQHHQQEVYCQNKYQ